MAMCTVVASACSATSSSSSAVIKSSNGSDKNVIAAARAQIKKYQGISPFVPSGPAVNAKKASGKSVLVVGYNADNSAVVAVAEGVQAAGSAVGLHVQVDYAQSTNSVAEQEILQGVAQHVVGIIVVGSLPLPVGPAAAKAAHIPMVGALQAEPVQNVVGQGNGPDYFGSASGSYKLDGELMADTAIVNANGKPINAVVDTFDFPVSTAVISGIKAVFDKCSNCKIVDTVTVEPASWATQLGPKYFSGRSVIPRNPLGIYDCGFDGTVCSSRHSGGRPKWIRKPCFGRWIGVRSVGPSEARPDHEG